MSAMEKHRFKVNYTDKQGMQQSERPRLVYTADGEHKSLFIGEQTILSTVKYEESDDVLWESARIKLGKSKD